MTEIVTIIAANVGAIAAVLLTAWRAARTKLRDWERMLALLDEQGRKIDVISKEVSLNAGKSLKDAVNRIDGMLAVLAELQHACIDNCGVATLILSPDGETMYATNKYHKITGLSVEDCHNWGWKRAIHPDDLAVVTESWTESLRTGQTFHGRFRYRHVETGEITPVEVTCRPIHTQAGRLAGWVAWIKPLAATEVRT